MRLRTLLFRIFFALLSGGIALLPTSFVQAQAVPLSVSITPPLFQLTIGPGDTWSSSVKVVNTNDTAVTYYAYTADFTASGETGNPSFVPVVSELNDPTLKTYSLASWITLTDSSTTIPAGASGQVPFTVHIPLDAEPGGHYAAILIGTQPTASSTAGTQVKISSYVSSLLFVRVKGNVVESGRIREFSTSQEFYQTPKADFTLRFENTGNTHVQPQGNIIIYNMWGKQRGEVPINQDEGGFGNVLPGSVRRFQFSWTGGSALDIGRYSAVATLAYGEDGKQNVSATTYFWVIPIVPLASALLGLLMGVLLITWLIRRYIRRALSLERGRLGLSETGGVVAEEVAYSVGVLVEPLREGVIDLRSLASGAGVSLTDTTQRTIPMPAQEERMTTWKLLQKYRLFLLFIFIVMIVGALIGRFVHSALVREQKFQITDVQIGNEPLSATSTGTSQ